MIMQNEGTESATYTYESLRSKIRPLDLILFRGGEFVSDSIGFLERWRLGTGDWTHSGVVVNLDVLPGIKNAQPDRLYVLESTSSLFASDVADIETGKHRLGVQIRDLENVVQCYLTSAKTKIGWCPLIDNPSVRNKDETEERYNERMTWIRKRLTALHEEVFEAFYDANCVDLFAGLFTICRPVRNLCRCSENLYFCSELVALVYKQIGLLPSNTDVRNVVPVDFLPGVDSDKSVSGLVEGNPILITKAQ